MNTKLQINQLFLFITVTFVLGVILKPFSNHFILYGVSLTLLIAVAIKPKRVTIICIGLLFFVLGNLRKNIQINSIQSDIGGIEAGYQPISFVVLKKLYAFGETTVFEASLKTTTRVKLGALLYFPNKLGELNPRQEYVTYQKIKLLKPKQAPYPDQYFHYLWSKHITHKVYLDQPPKLRKEIAFSLRSWLIQKRLVTANNVEKYAWSPKVLSFLKSFILGERSGISKELIRVFRNTGLMHVLSISGLHIGMLYLILIIVFRRVLYLHEQRWIKSIFILSLLWGYVLFIGAPISAIRAASMFSLFDLSKKLYRKQHLLDILFVFIFVVVLLDPLVIENLSFQLSITAVFFIIAGMHFWTQWWTPSHFFTKTLWQILGVTLFAQLGLLPLLIHYFHQFPLLFLVANIPVLLVMPIIFVSSLLIVVWCQFSFRFESVFNIYDTLISVLIDYITWVADFEGTVLKELQINTTGLIVTYLLVLLVLIQVFRQKFKYWYIILVINLFLGYAIINTLKSRRIKELWVLEEKKKVFIADRSGRKLEIYTNSDEAAEDSYIMKFWTETVDFNFVNYKVLQNVYYLKDNCNLRIIDNEFVLIEEGDYCIILGNPKLNFDRLLQQKPSMILFSSDMYWNQKEKYKRSCIQNKIPYWDLKKEGGVNLLNL